MNDIARILIDSKLFSGLNGNTIERIASHCRPVRFAKDQVIFRQGDIGDSMYIVGEGAVAVLKEMGKSYRKVAELGPGEHFGEMALLSFERRNATVRAVENALCIQLDQAGFDALLDEDARFSQRMLRVISDRLKRTDEAATRDMVLAQQALTFALAKLADSRDPETGAHLYRVRDYCTLLAGLLADHPKFRDIVTESFIENMYLVAPLHDIGKVAMPDGILLKQGKLTEAEFGIMVTHTSIGADALDTVLQFCNFEVFQMARRVIFCHHERYDGSGYPRGLKGDEIPVEARIMTLADIYDALLSKRVYKPPMGYEEVRERMAALAGTHLDPDMTRVMLDYIEKFEEIHRNYTEQEAEHDDLART